MTDPETLEEAKALIAMLQKARETAIDQREEARAQVRAITHGFVQRADALKATMRQAKVAIHALEGRVIGISVENRDALELSLAALEALDKALMR